jgi:hypothetical protein
MVQINISDEVWKELQKNAIPLVDTPDSIIRKLLQKNDNKNLEPAHDLSGQEICMQNINTSVRPINNVQVPDSEIISLLEGKRLRHITQKGIEHCADVKNGIFIVENKPFKPCYSPSCAAIYAAGGSINGWTFWEYFDSTKNMWLEIANLRQYSRSQIQKALENKQ